MTAEEHLTRAEHLLREQHLRLAREAVRRAISISRQIEQHAIYLNDDNVEYLRDHAAQERVRAREHIRQAGLAST
jgi:sulfur relay (sulfurtransferase) DsrF/TusC family protein